MKLNNDKHQASFNRIEALFLNGHPISTSWSGGKDSSVLLDITLLAARSSIKKGATPFILVTNSDTGVENPEISLYIQKEVVKIESYARQHGVQLEVHVAYPKLNDSWAVQIISGRCLPSFPQTNSDCSVDLKVKPMTTLRRKLLKDVVKQTGKEVITLVGTRTSESTNREAKMKKRNETHLEPTRNQNGDLVFAAIADFETDDVWEWIGLSRSDLIESYSDFNDLTRIYADAGNTSCAVISDAITEGMKSIRGGCGARTGCVVCTKVKDDKSLTAMIESDNKRYGYMAAPTKLREFLVKTQWDYNRRQWLGKTIDAEGRIAVRPDTYSPAMCLDLLRYALTIDVEERKAAAEVGLSSPRFELVPIDALVAIDALWSLQGWHKPFQAIMEYVDIIENGKRYPVPTVEEIQRTPMPKAQYIFVEEKLRNAVGVYDGMRDAVLELQGESHCMGTREINSGKIVMDVELETSFKVDLEGAYMALDFELDTMMRMHNQSNLSITQGYRWWLRMGVISLAPQQINIHDQILKRTRVKELMGIAGPSVSVDTLLSMSNIDVHVEPNVHVLSAISNPVQLDLFAA